MYTAVVLDERSQSTLINEFMSKFPDWEIICHHMTINMKDAKQGPAFDLLGQEFKLVATHFAFDDKVAAVKVDTEVPSVKTLKHITVAVNRKNGGKPSQSNSLSDWQPLPKPIILYGTVQEVS
mgnify:FL=1